MSNPVGNRLKTHREILGLKLTEVSRKLNISISFLSDIEKGNRQISQYIHLVRFCEIYGINQLGKEMLLKDIMFERYKNYMESIEYEYIRLMEE